MAKQRDTKLYKVKQEGDLSALGGKRVVYLGLGDARYEGIHNGRHVFLGRCPADDGVIQLHNIRVGEVKVTRDGDIDGTGNRDYREYVKAKEPLVFSALEMRLKAVGVR